MKGLKGLKGFGVGVVMFVLFSFGFLGESVLAGPDVTGVTAMGPIFREGGKTWVNTVFSPEISIQTGPDWQIVTRAGYWFENRPGPDDVQSLTVFMLYKYQLPWVGTQLRFGSGLVSRFQEGNDIEAGALKLEFGVKFYKDLGLAVGADWVYSWGEAAVYCGIDLTPKL